MKRLLRQSIHWHPGRPAWGAAMVAGFGCALPLLLGLFSGHPGFLWATVGAFQAAKANPLHRFGMLRMLLLIALGAGSAGLGFWSATHPGALNMAAKISFFFSLKPDQALGVVYVKSPTFI